MKIMQERQVHIHFVCTANAYRSRLAETYLLSKQIPDIDVSSSGVREENYRNVNGPISWQALRLLTRYGLIPFLPKNNSTQTTPQQLQQADLVIFMRDRHHQIAKEELNFNGNYEVWNISDIAELERWTDIYDQTVEPQMIQATEEMFQHIKRRVDDLAERFAPK